MGIFKSDVGYGKGDDAKLKNCYDFISQKTQQKGNTFMKKIIRACVVALMAACFVSGVAAAVPASDINKLSEQFIESFYQLPDSFTQKTGAMATVFIRQGNDFVRVAPDFVMFSTRY